MAKPRVFVSSTYYDLKHIRSSLELFIESIGYEPVLSEKGDIAYHPDVALDESCYREASSADIFVLIIGGRYGAAISNHKNVTVHEFYDRYDSITRREYEVASNLDIPIYILIETNVHSEYQTFLKNRDKEAIVYAHVDSVNIFHLIDYILSRPRNNPVFNFDRSSQIENWLREQWAGLFREILKTRSQQKQISALTEQVGELKAANDTLKTYLEAVMRKVDPGDSSQVIRKENELQQRSIERRLISKNDLFKFISADNDIGFEKIRQGFIDAETFSDLLSNLRSLFPANKRRRIDVLVNNSAALEDANLIRDILHLTRFPNLDES